jgi:cell division septum initiation protein DivIVA
MQKDKLEKLASERSNPCVTISMKTHKTSPENKQDVIEFKNLIKEAFDKIQIEFGQRSVSDLLKKIETLEEQIDFAGNMESLHIFLSNSTCEIVRSTWSTSQNKVVVAENFEVRSLIKEFNRTEEYLILTLNHSGIRMLHAINDHVVGEISNDDFPYENNPHIETEHDNLSDSKRIDNLAREYFNNIDKAVVRIHNKTALKVVVICTEDNYSYLMQVADFPAIYLGHSAINNKNAHHSVATDAWPVVHMAQQQERLELIKEMQEAIGQHKVLTDLSAIFQAAKEGRGDLLIVQEDFKQAVRMTGEYSFDLLDDNALTGTIDDITSEIAWEVISKKGRAIFTDLEEFKIFGNYVLKVRY